MNTAILIGACASTVSHRIIVYGKSKYAVSVLQFDGAFDIFSDGSWDTGAWEAVWQNFCK